MTRSCIRFKLLTNFTVFEPERVLIIVPFKFALKSFRIV